MRNVTNFTVDTKKIAAVIIVLAVIVVALGSYFTVPAGSVAIKLRFGKIIGSYTEGLHLKLPLIDKVEKFSISDIR